MRKLFFKIKILQIKQNGCSAKHLYHPWMLCQNNNKVKMKEQTIANVILT